MQNFIYGRKIPKRTIPSNSWVHGMGDYDKGGGDYYIGRGADIRTNPRQLSILPAALKESGSIVTDLVKWGERVTGRSSVTPNTFLYGDNGNLYQRTGTPTYTLLRTVAISHGNGMRWFGEDDYLYYTGDKTIGRYGPISNASPTFNDDFLTSLGGTPTNTNSVTFTAASSMYLNHADGAAFDITGDLTIEVYVKPNSLPTVGNSMTLAAKWDEATNHRSYKFDIYAISGYFGNNQDGNLTISSNTTDAPIDSAASGTSGAVALTATNASFAQGQYILIIQMQGTGAGSWQKTTIAGYTAGTITTSDPLNFSYAGQAQVLVGKQYGNVTVNSSITWTPKAWNGTTGGILFYLANGTITINGIVDGNGFSPSGISPSNGGGFRGGGYSGLNTHNAGYSGEGSVGASTLGGTGNGNGGDAGPYSSSTQFGSGSGGSNGTQGTSGSAQNISASNPGAIVGSADLTTMLLGGGGGSGANSDNSDAGIGGNGGAILFMIGTTITVAASGTVRSNGGNGGVASVGGAQSEGAAGAGGSILFKSQVFSNAGTISALGGTGGVNGAKFGGNGGNGRIHLDYLTSNTNTGTITPAMTATQDNTLVTTTTSQMRIGISDNGTAFEYLTKNLPVFVTGSWGGRLSASWKASTSTATFYVGGTKLGTSVGTKTSINNNASAFTVAANNGGSGIANYADMKFNDLRLWSIVRTDTQIANYKDVQLVGNESGLNGYWEFNNDYSDDTSNANTLTAVNTPVFTTDVPFAGVTSRLDVDQTASANTNAYLLLQTISESGVNFRTFVPTIDPQKSISFTVTAVGTGDWTVTIHDAFNNVVATQTITHANVPASGTIEFVFATPWSPTAGATYHFHLTSSVASDTASIVANTTNDLSTAAYTTYFSWLITDTLYHPIERTVNIIAIGNGRYVSTWDGGTYTPNRLKLPSPWKVRCLAQWNDYIAIGCWKGASITDYDEGIIFLWNAANVGNPNATYDVAIPVPMGGINAILGVGQILYFFAGYQGDLCRYVLGGEAEKVKRIPKITDATYVEVLPGAMSMWHSIMRFGLAGNSNSTVIQKGAYSYGHRNSGEPDSLSLDFPISTGNYLNTVQIGMLLPEDNKLLMSWRDGTGTGIDVIDPVNNGCQPSMTVEEFIFDAGFIWKNKKVPYLETNFQTLLTGQSITLKYKIDRASAWTTYTILPTDAQIKTNNGMSKFLLPISEVKVGQVTNGVPDLHNEVQVAVDAASTTGVSPVIMEHSFLEDFLLTEQEGIPQ